MAKSSGKGEGKSTPSTTTTTTATDAASVAVNSGKQSSENAGLTNPSNPSKGEDSKGENNNPSNDSQATDAAGVTLGRGEYTPGATYNAQGQQTSGWSSGPGMGSGSSSSPTPNAFEKGIQAGREAKQRVQQEGFLSALQHAPEEQLSLVESAAHFAGTLKGLFGSDGDSKGEESSLTTPTYNPAITAEANTPASMKESSKAAPTTESVTTPSNTAEAISNLGSVLGHNDYTPGTPAETSANNNINQQAQSSSGYINRGSTISTTGTGGSISSGLSVPERDTESIGLGVYDPDKANYDQDNWNRGMEQQSSSVVSDEQCKQFAMRAFHEDSPAFKVVKTTIIKKLD